MLNTFVIPRLTGYSIHGGKKEKKCVKLAVICHLDEQPAKHSTFAHLTANAAPLPHDQMARFWDNVCDASPIVNSYRYGCCPGMHVAYNLCALLA